MVLGAAFSGVGAGFSGAANGSNVSSNASFIGPVQSANGNLFSGGDIVPFSKGGIPDSGSNYQTFPMSGGKTGSLREKGPEFIMPASRDAFGQLGVKANLSGIGGNQTTNIINVTVSNDGKQTADQLGTKVADAAMRAIAKQEISNASRPGNQLNRTTKVA
jgi:phage-related minor tail protein